MRRRTAGALGSAIASTLTMAMFLPCSCRDATEISLEVTTNVTWREGIVTTFTVGGDTQTTEGAAITTESSAPWSSTEPRFVGSLTVVPKDPDSSVVSVKIVMGFVGDGDARKCAPPLYQGCIVARRRLLFVAHQRLRVPIRMYAQCVDVPCDAFSTCNELRQCVVSEVACDGPSCAEPGGVTDPSLVDASGDRIVTTATDASDAAEPDGDKDSGQPLGSDGGAGLVACGNTTCPTPSFYCCFSTAQPSSSQCMVSATEQQCVQQLGGIALRCDGPGDCPGLANHCCTASSTSACAQTCGIVPELCQDTPTGCEGARQCRGVIYGMYARCE